MEQFLFVPDCFCANKLNTPSNKQQEGLKYPTNRAPHTKVVL